MLFSPADIVVVCSGIAACWYAMERPSQLPAGFLAGVDSPLWLGAAAAVASSHILYAAVWYYPSAFSSACAHFPLNLLGGNAVTVFAALVALAKGVQQLGLLAIVGHAVAPASMADWPRALLNTALSAGATRWAVAGVLFVAGQALNLGIYRAIGKDGVYYGFKLGRPVPWSTAFPFNLGFRHPQYVGGMLCQLGVLLILANASALAAGLPALAAWWLALYALTAWMEAAGDNEGGEKAKRL